MEIKSRMWGYILVLLACVSISVFVAVKLTAKDYVKLISEKEKQIEELQSVANEYEQKMQTYKAQAKYLAQQIVKSSERINAIREEVKRKKEIVVLPPETTEETVRRLKEAGFEPIVDCK